MGDAAEPRRARPQGHRIAKQDENPLDLTCDLGLWTVVVFVLLLFILRKFAWKPMLEGLQKREENIRSALVEASKAPRGSPASSKLSRRRDGQDAANRCARRSTRPAATPSDSRDEMVARAKQEIQAERAAAAPRDRDRPRTRPCRRSGTRAAQLATLISAKAIRRSSDARRPPPPGRRGPGRLPRQRRPGGSRN